jgi:TRAP-type C4-dicarboxylate transport system permease small subunit
MMAIDTPPPEPRASLPARLLRLTGRLEDGLLAVLLITMIGLAVAQIVLRNVFSSGLLWGDALLRVMVLWVGMLGAMAATRDDKQITVDVLSRILPSRWKVRARVVTDLFTTAVAALVAWHGGRLVMDDRAAGSMAFAGVPVWVCELVLPVAFAIIAVRYLLMAVIHLRQGLAREEDA